MRQAGRLLSLLALLAVLAPVRAQTLAQGWITVAPEQCVWHAGDDPAWAASNLDDSAWKPYSAWKLDVHTPRFWVRCHVSLAPLGSLSRPALQVHLYAASQLFVDGVLIGSSGNIKSAQFSLGVLYTVPLSPASLQPGATLALRIAIRETDQGQPAQILLGDDEALGDHRAGVALTGLLGYLPIGLCYALIGVVGFMLLGLWVTDRSRLELLLLAILCWLLCDLRLSELCQKALVPLSSILFDLAYGCGEVLMIVWIWFVYRLAGKRVPWIYRVAAAGTAMFLINLILDAVLPPALSLRLDALYFALSGYIFLFALAGATAAMAAFWPWSRIPAHLRAMAFCCMAWGGADFLWFALWELDVLGILSNAQTTEVQKYLLILRAVTTLCCILALLTIFFRGQHRVAEERALLAGEMQAAREIQVLLSPPVLETISGLRVDVAFHPMRDVGGDFYLCRPLPDGRQRILIGDVSGKGTAAAMTATLLIGAAEQRDSDTPAVLLRHLNNVLRLSRVGGFATCLCADIFSDGSVALANAGHLPPYCRGEEVPIHAALPLGVAARDEAAYEATGFHLAPGDTLTFLSDGVVEAQNATGQLFGFDRARNISVQSAEEIASAAQRHGQQDDITVLTLAFAGAG